MMCLDMYVYVWDRGWPCGLEIKALDSGSWFHWFKCHQLPLEPESSPFGTPPRLNKNSNLGAQLMLGIDKTTGYTILH